MFRKYKKTFRVSNSRFKVPGKLNLSKKEQQDLLTGRVTIEEKIDGANTGVIGGRKGKEFRLQKRGSLVDVSEHPQFGRLKAWSMERYQSLTELKFPYVMYGEFMWATHHIYYDSLPDWFICIDIWDGKKHIKREEKQEICDKLEIEIVPLIYDGYIEDINEILELVCQRSSYSSEHDQEGIVIKNYRKQMRGKIVRPEFVKEINEDGVHWTSKWDSRKINKLK